MNLCVVAMRNPHTGKTELYISKTHLFGLSAAVVNFNRLPELMTANCRRIGCATSCFRRPGNPRLRRGSFRKPPEQTRHGSLGGSGLYIQPRRQTVQKGEAPASLHNANTPAAEKMSKGFPAQQNNVGTQARKASGYTSGIARVQVQGRPTGQPESNYDNRREADFSAHELF